MSDIISTTITNPLTLSAAETTITGTGGVIITPQGTTVVDGAVYTGNVARTLTNYGTIVNKQTGFNGVGVVGGTGIVLNKPGALINGAGAYGVELIGYVGDFRSGHGTLLSQPTVINGGTITGGNTEFGGGIAGGIDSYIWNQQSGIISGSSSGITFGGYPRAGSTIWSGTVVNDGTIIDHGGADAIQFLSGVSGTVVNHGLITTTPTGGNYEGNYGVVLTQGGVITNTGTIEGTYVGLWFRLGGTVLPGSVTVTNAGTIEGSEDAIQFQAAQTNLLVVDPGAVFIGHVAGGTPATSTLELAAGGAGTLAGLGSKYTNFGTLTFDPSSNWLVSASSAGIASTLINGFNVNDEIRITNFTATSYAVMSGNQQLVLTNSVNAHETLSFGAPVSGFQVTAGAFGTDIEYAAVCYLRGTRILTVTGEVPVEDLQPGDVLVTRFGPLRPIRWIGKQSFDGRFLSKAGAPIRIRAGALGDNTPCRDLLVSPDHSVVIGDHLVLARLLLNGVSITQEATAEQVDYFHVDLGRHDCVIADGAWAESYAEQDNRSKFHNAAEFAELFPDHQTTSQAYCLPRVAKDAASLLALRVSVLARLPSGHFTDDADVHLSADGLRFEPRSVDEGCWEFAVPAGVSALRLVTHATSPAIMGTGFDDRALGFCITSLTARIGAATVTWSPTSHLLRDGWYPAESNSTHVWRWTDGDAALPAVAQLALSLDDARDPVVLTITGTCLRRYLLTELPTAVLASDSAPSGVPLAMTA